MVDGTGILTLSVGQGDNPPAWVARSLHSLGAVDWLVGSEATMRAQGALGQDAYSIALVCQVIDFLGGKKG